MSLKSSSNHLAAGRILTQCRWTSAVISSSAQYGVIPHDHWNQPDWIDEERAKASREAMVDANIIYGGMFQPNYILLVTYTTLGSVS